MFQNKTIIHSVEINGVELTLQTGLLAQQATSSVLATIGETTVLAVTVVGKETNADYFPLQVMYEERLYASGKIKGSRFIKREGRPSDDAILTGRMIDRSLRSLFSSQTRSEVQVIVTVLSLDEVHQPDTIAVLAASASMALALEDFHTPISNVRIGLVKSHVGNTLFTKIKTEIDSAPSLQDIQDSLNTISKTLNSKKAEDNVILEQLYSLLSHKNPEWAAKFRVKYKSDTRWTEQEILQYFQLQPQFISLPTYEDMETSVLDLVVSGTGDSIVMLESGAHIVSEDIISQALDIAETELKKLNTFQVEFIKKVEQTMVLEKKKLVEAHIDEIFVDYWRNFYQDIATAVTANDEKDGRSPRAKAMQELKDLHYDVMLKLSQDEEVVSPIADHLHKLAIAKETWNLKKELEEGFGIILHEIVRAMAFEGKRVDGRKMDQTRNIQCAIDFLPRTHGSSLFNRGETQVMNVMTLGTARDALTLDNMEDFEEGTQRYIHHYNFPHYSVGETGRYGPPKRREIGHGALAEKALLPVLPSEDIFPYTIRLVSECLGSNGSTSMASTCASTLSLMAGGVPLSDMVAGVAMGLMFNSNDGSYVLLTDIQGFEDYYGDMDFKVTGTKDGITAIQLDNKAAGLPTHIIKQALQNSKKARQEILDIMAQTIAVPRKQISEYAPGVIQTRIPVEKIGEVIGPSGKIIKAIIQEFGVEIDIEDDGRVYIYGKDSVAAQAAMEVIEKKIKVYKKNDTVSAEIYRIESYGAFAKIDGGDREAMLHISQISENRVNKVEDVLKIGQIVQATILDVSEKGISLTLVPGKKEEAKPARFERIRPSISTSIEHSEVSDSSESSHQIHI
jgi:polyribonucleotide nucleotidyltransferase